MKDEDKSSEELIGELARLRLTVASLEAKKADFNEMVDSLWAGWQKLQSIIGESSDGIVLINEQGDIVEWNKGMEKISGIKRREVIGRPAWKVQSFPIKTQKGTMIGNIVRDITEHKKMEKELRSSEARYRAIIEDQTELICRFTPGGTITFVNKAFIRCFSRNGGDMIGQSIFELVPDEYRLELKDCIESSNLEKPVTTFERQALLPEDGSTRWYQWTLHAIFSEDGNLIEIQSTGRDVTTLKKVEEDLRLANRRLQDIIEFLPDATFVVDGERKVIAWNRAIEEMTGIPKEEIVGRGGCAYSVPFYEKAAPVLIDLIFGEDASTESRYNYLEKENGAVYAEIFIPSMNGGKGAFLWGKASPLLNKDGQLVGAIESIRDITSFRRAEEALEAERKRLFSVLESLPASLYLKAQDYSIRFANRYFREHFGDPEGMKCYEILCGKLESCEDCHARSVYETKIPVNREWTSPAGRIYQVTNYPFEDVDGSPLVLSIGVDVTENKMFEKEMARLDRLHLVGEMAAGIGHEIRNPMTTVRGFLQWLGEKKENSHQKEYFNLMIEELDRANAIISEFLSLARNKPVELKENNLNSILETVLPLIRSDAMKMDKYVNLDMGEITCLLLDEKEIRQVILNLIRNGLEATSPNGVITVKTFLEDSEVVLAVCDQGKGIAPDVLEKIGTPFFTTKDNGTGLGLAVCYSIAARHGASIKVETGPEGTIFYVRFKLKEDL